MQKVTVENFRCFHDAQSVRIKPITILLGENSSGKTSILAASRIAWDISNGVVQPNFNEDPFLFGGFDQIASYGAGKRGRARSFVISAEYRVPSRQSGKNLRTNYDIRVSGRFIARGGQPFLSEWRLCSEPYELKVTIPVGEGDTLLHIKTPRREIDLKSPIRSIFGLNLQQVFSLVSYISKEESHKAKDSVEPIQPEDRGDFERINQIGYSLFSYLDQRPFAVAPIRTKPQRTYDPVADQPRPEGSHIPMILARAKAVGASEWQNLHDSIAQFGKASGLFSDLLVTRKGRKETDPFQISVKVSGPASNLVDVGYGVSQVLPIMVDAIRQPRGTTFLMQQPEVHLHPKAQAELATYMGTVAKSHRKRFIIETHSDYIIDRLRSDVRDKRHLSCDDIAVYYLERLNNTAVVNEMAIDDHGNIHGAPRSYRQFFLDEEKRLLGE